MPKTKIISLNANGIRAAARKGLFDWLQQEDADVVCIQETKAQYEQLEPDPVFFPSGYHHYYVDAVKKGYSGVAVYSRVKPKKVITQLGVEEFDNEGRWKNVSCFSKRFLLPQPRRSRSTYQIDESYPQPDER